MQRWNPKSSVATVYKPCRVEKCCNILILYLLANLGFDTAENEPAKNVQKIAKTWVSIISTGPEGLDSGGPAGAPGTPGGSSDGPVREP